jgi:chromosome partitioning protein
MQTLTLLSQKGGSGKTTLAIHLAAEASRRGLRTLLIDLDPQASAARWADRRGDRPPDVSSEHPGRIEAVIADAARRGYQLAVLDTAPHADQAALQAARIADLVLIPCRPSILDLDAVQATLDLCHLAKRRALVVINAAPVRSRVVADARTAIERLHGTVADAVMHERVALRHALVAGDVAAEYEPDGPAAAEVEALFALACNPASAQTSKHIGVQ